jgi:hypothetical protein
MQDLTLRSLGHGNKSSSKSHLMTSILNKYASETSCDEKNSVKCRL